MAAFLQTGEKDQLLQIWQPKPGHFITLDNGRYIVYSERIVHDDRYMHLKDAKKYYGLDKDIPEYIRRIYEICEGYDHFVQLYDAFSKKTVPILKVTRKPPQW